MTYRRQPFAYARGSFMLLIIVGTLLAPSLAAADVSGTWMGLIPRKGTRPAEDVALKLEQTGNSLSGKLYRDDGPGSPILEGEVSDTAVWFTVEAREQRGNQINLVLYRFEGELAEGAMEITRERAAARNAVSGVEVPVRRPQDSDEEDRARRFHSFRFELLF